MFHTTAAEFLNLLNTNLQNKMIHVLAILMSILLSECMILAINFLLMGCIVLFLLFLSYTVTQEGSISICHLLMCNSTLAETRERTQKVLSKFVQAAKIFKHHA